MQHKIGAYLLKKVNISFWIELGLFSNQYWVRIYRLIVCILRLVFKVDIDGYQKKGQFHEWDHLKLKKKHEIYTMKNNFVMYLYLLKNCLFEFKVFLHYHLKYYWLSITTFDCFYHMKEIIRKIMNLLGIFLQYDNI